MVLHRIWCHRRWRGSYLPLAGEISVLCKDRTETALWSQQTWRMQSIPIIRMNFLLFLFISILFSYYYYSFQIREKHEENHQPAMHKGVVIKWNANQRYATTSITAFLLKELAKRHQVPIQVRVPKHCIHQKFINNEFWIIGILGSQW